MPAAATVKKQSPIPISSGKVLYFDPESPDLVVDESKNGRFKPYELEDVVDLMNDIKVHGVMEPALAFPAGKGKYELYAGYGRWKSCLFLKQSTGQVVKLPVIVKEMNEEEAFLRNISENQRRRSTTVVDDAHNIRRLQDLYGKSDEEILQIYARDGKPMSPAWLLQTRKILRLSPAQQNTIHSQNLAASLAYFIAEIPDADVREKVLEGALDEARSEAVAALPIPMQEAQAIIAEATGGKNLPEEEFVERVAKTAQKRGYSKTASKKIAAKSTKVAHPKPELKHAQKASVKAGAAPDIRSRKLNDVRDLFGKLGGPGAGPVAQRNFCNAVLDWMEGKIDTKKVEQVITKLFKK